MLSLRTTKMSLTTLTFWPIHCPCPIHQQPFFKGTVWAELSKKQNVAASPKEAKFIRQCTDMSEHIWNCKQNGPGQIEMQ